jgi:hypothetical protein
MQQQTPKPEDYSMNDFNALIESIKKHSGLSEEEIALKINYNKGYISQARSRGEVSTKFVQQLKAAFANSLQNARPPVHEEIDQESRRTLERTLENLSEDKIRSTAIIERLVTMLERQFSSPGLTKTQEGSFGPEGNRATPGFAPVKPLDKGEKEKPRGKH